MGQARFVQVPKQSIAPGAGNFGRKRRAPPQVKRVGIYLEDAQTQGLVQLPPDGMFELLLALTAMSLISRGKTTPKVVP